LRGRNSFKNLIICIGDNSTSLLKRDQPWSNVNRYPLSEPEHDSYTKNSLMNDLQSSNEVKKGFESTCKFVYNILNDCDLGENKKFFLIYVKISVFLVKNSKILQEYS